MAELEFEGASFAVADKVGLMPLLRFAHLSKQGVEANDMEGMSAIYDLLRSVIADEDWGRFEDHASVVRADGDDLMGIVSKAIELIAQRPTVRPSESSDGPQATTDSSVGDSSSRVIRRLEQEGRPSIALAVRQAQDSRVSA